MSGSIIANEWFICDNPLDMIPEINSRRYLPDYCKNLYDEIEDFLLNLLGLILS